MTIKKLTDTSSSTLDDTIKDNKATTQNTAIVSSKTSYVDNEHLAKNDTTAQNRTVSPTSTRAKLCEVANVSKTNLDAHAQLKALHDAVVADSPILVESLLKKLADNSSVELTELLQATNLFNDIYDNVSTTSLITVVKFILMGDFSEEAKIRMLSTKNINGKPVLYNMFFNSELRKCSEEIISLIITSNLAIENKIKLLQAQTDTGSNWLYDMLQANEVKAVQSCANFILNTDDLTKNTKYALLTPINIKPISLDILAKNEAVNELQDILAEKYPISYHQEGYSDEEIRKLKKRKIAKLEEAGREYRENGDLINYPSKGTCIHLNCTVPAFHKQDTRIKKRRIDIAPNIQCRHLAFLYVRDTGKPSELFKQLDSFEKLATHLEFEKDLEVVQRLSTKVSKTGYLFNINNFPLVMKKVILKNWGKPNYQERFMLTSGSHAMNIKLENKDNGKFTKISFYDPDNTAQQVNTNVYKSKDIDKLTINFVANNNLIAKSFECFEGIGALLSANLTTENNCETFIESDITPGLCVTAARAGHFKSADLGWQINSKYTADEIFHLYNIECGAIHEAMHYTNPENLTYIIESILASPMTQEQKVHLLANPTGLSREIMENNAFCIAFFCKEILSSGVLSEEDKYAILTQNTQGSNALCFGFAFNNSESIRVFIKAILTSDLTEVTKRKMFTVVINSQKVLVRESIYSSPESFYAFIDTVTEFASEELRNKIFADNEITPSDTYNMFADIVFSSIAEIEKHIAHMPFLEEYNTTHEKLEYIIGERLEQAYEAGDYRYITEFLEALFSNENITDLQRGQILDVDTQQLEVIKNELLLTSISVRLQATNILQALDMFK